MDSVLTYDEIQEDCLRDGRVYMDPDFSARKTSITPHGENPEDWLWRRPMEISDKPKFITPGLKHYDLVPGAAEDCWFVGAAAVLSCHPGLFAQVVPKDQSFEDGYTGAFRFRFWQFGEWVEVVVDDRLPVTPDNALRFGQNRARPEECWLPLMEKAYAKLHGSYSAIKIGLMHDALVDLTGGVPEVFNLMEDEKLPPDLLDIVGSSFRMGSVIALGIWGEVGAMTEQTMWNGLYKGHAYSVTGFLETRIQGWNVKLFRLKNPSGQKEWTGAWSEGSDEWLALTEEERQEIGLSFEEDGEFWISFEDMLLNFRSLAIIHLDAEYAAKVKPGLRGSSWDAITYRGRWVSGVNAGGCGILAHTNDIYFTNPQFYLKLKEPDEHDPGHQCTCLISLLHKGYSRKKVCRRQSKLITGFDIHALKGRYPEMLESDSYFERAILKKQHQIRSAVRETSLRIQLDPGLYCLVASTSRHNQEADFIIRILTFNRIPSGSFEEQTVTTFSDGSFNLERPVGTVSNDLFLAFASDEYVVDARDLRDLLAELYKQEYGETITFGIESCRSLISMMDADAAGVLDYHEMARLWDEILYWKKIFQKYDKDKSGCVETYDLRRIFADMGISLHLDILTALVVRYGGKDKTLSFEDFVLCLARTMSLHHAFRAFSGETPGEAHVDLDQWLCSALYL